MITEAGDKIGANEYLEAIDKNIKPLVFPFLITSILKKR
jgi:hypothetical protein